MAMPFFVALTAILLVGRYLPFALPVNARALLAGGGVTPARAAKCAISVAIAGLAQLVTIQSMSMSMSSAAEAVVAVEARALWFNTAALFLGTLLGVVAVALQRAPPFAQAAVDHLAVATEMVAINAFAHNVCIFAEMFKFKV